MMKRIGRIYGLEATSQLVDDRLFDEITKTTSSMTRWSNSSGTTTRML